MKYGVLLREGYIGVLGLEDFFFFFNLALVFFDKRFVVRNTNENCSEVCRRD